MNIPNPKLPKKFATEILSRMKKITMKTNNIRDKTINTFFNQGRDIKSSVNNAKIND